MVGEQKVQIISSNCCLNGKSFRGNFIGLDANHVDECWDWTQRESLGPGIISLYTYHILVVFSLASYLLDG